MARATARLEEKERQILEWRVRDGEAIEASYRELPQGPEEDAAALANAITMTEAEP